jgi:uncharacterized protein (DUF2141 family)
MRYETKRKVRIAVPALAAASVASWLGAPAAHAGFNLTVGPAEVSGGDSAYVIYAFASPTSVTTPPPVGATNGLPAVTSNLVNGLDVTLDTAPTAGALVIDLNADIDGDGAADADVVGAPDGTFGTGHPSFGGTNGTLGTFIGFGQENSGKTGYNTTAISPSSSLIKSETVYEGSNTSTQNPNYKGVLFPSTYLTGPVTSDYESGSGTLDPDYTNGTVHSLELVEALSNTALYNPGLTTLGIPIANVVVPSGTAFTVTAALAYDTSGDKQLVSTVGGASSVAPPPPFHGFQAHDVTELQTPLLGTVTMSGGNGSYVPQTVTFASPANNGSVEYSGFTAGDTVDIALKFSNGAGSDPYTTNSAAILAYLTADNTTAGVTFASLPSNLDSVFPGFDAIATFTAGAADPFADFNFSDYTGGGTLDLAAVGLVPEPMGLGVILLGGLGLISRRKRQQA